MQVYQSHQHHLCTKVQQQLVYYIQSMGYLRNASLGMWLQITTLYQMEVILAWLLLKNNSSSELFDHETCALLPQCWNYKFGAWYKISQGGRNHKSVKSLSTSLCTVRWQPFWGKLAFYTLLHEVLDGAHIALIEKENLKAAYMSMSGIQSKVLQAIACGCVCMDIDTLVKQTPTFLCISNVLTLCIIG